MLARKRKKRHEIGRTFCRLKKILNKLLSSHSTPFRKAKALYACKAEHDSELSFTAGTVFDNVHPSQEPGWLEGTLNGKTGLIPENYVEFL